MKTADDKTKKFVSVLIPGRCQVPSIDCSLCGDEYNLIVDDRVTVGELEDYKCPRCRTNGRAHRHDCIEGYQMFLVYWEEKNFHN
jgi:hypothetical protein